MDTVGCTVCALKLVSCTISKEHVCLLLTILDSRGVAIRASRRSKRREYNAKRPNDFDGYDKLKSYTGCVSMDVSMAFLE